MSQTIKLKAAKADAMLNSPLFGQVVKKSFPIRTSYDLAYAVEKLNQEMKTYFVKKQEIINENAIKVDGKVKQLPGGFIDFGDNKETVEKKMAEIGEIDIKIPVKPIKLNFDDCPNVTVEEMFVIMPLLADANKSK